MLSADQQELGDLPLLPSRSLAMTSMRALRAGIFEEEVRGRAQSGEKRRTTVRVHCERVTSYGRARVCRKEYERDEWRSRSLALSLRP